MSNLRRQLLRRQLFRGQVPEDNRQVIVNRKKKKHIRDNARHYAFIHDLLSYSLSEHYQLSNFMTEHGLRWSMIDLIETENYHNNRRFQPEIGKAVLRYQRRHEKDIIQEINRVVPCAAFGSMVDALLLLAESTFKGENFAKEFFRFCALIVTIGVSHMLNGQIWRVDSIVEDLYDVYIIFFKQRFAALDGWHILHSYAVKYCIYED